MRHRTILVFVAAALFLWTAAPAAHDVPNDVRIQVFLQPQGQVLRLSRLCPSPLSEPAERISRNGLPRLHSLDGSQTVG